MYECALTLGCAVSRPQHLSKAEEYDANTSNCAFVRLKANLSLGDDAAATAAIHKLTQCDDFEAGYLRISCSEALDNGMKGVALKALQLLHVEVRRSKAKGKGSTSQELSGAHHGSGQLSYADKLSEATILRCILTLAIKQLEAKGSDAKEPAHETAEADERTHGAAVLSKYDQVGALADRLAHSDIKFTRRLHHMMPEPTLPS